MKHKKPFGKHDFHLRSELLNIYFVVSYLLILGLCGNYLTTLVFPDTRSFLFAIAVYLSYGIIYLLPTILLTKTIHFVLSRNTRKNDISRWRKVWVYGVAVVMTSATGLYLFVDQMIFRLYGFHLNGFVWNLIITPGGIESMGWSNSTMMTFGVITAALIGIQAALLWGIHGFFTCCLKQSLQKPRKIYRYAIAVLALLAFGERIEYGISHIQGYSPVLSAANAFPFYLPATFRSLAKKLGYKIHRKDNMIMDLNTFHPAYPLEPLEVETPDKPLNVIWLVAESWRWDMLDPEIMPATWKFGEKAHFFRHHYSGGNGTRMGMFTMFYGLYGPYWFRFLDEQRSPVLMDVIQEQGYQLNMYTSAKFSYPEFDKTIFAKVPDKFLHEYSSGPGWQRDRKNVTDMLEFLKMRDRSHPFMTFMFFESPHARYYFPQESVIRKPYLEDFNYATVSLDHDIELIKNRYTNSCHHLDSQFKRILDFLENENLLENTIVIITGDHGEEFMEKGRWGHNSEFTEEQLRVPLLIWVPGTGSDRVDRMTSHLDIVPTLLPLMGVKNPAKDVCLGHNLFGQAIRRYTVVSDWSRIGYVGEKYKAIFPFRSGIFTQNRITTLEDQAVENDFVFFRKNREALVNVMLGLSQFRLKK